MTAKGQFPKFMGLDWTNNMHYIDWNIIMKPNPICLIHKSMNLRYGDKYPYIFIPNTNPICEFRVSLQLKDDATSVFCHARHPPIPLRKAIEEELHTQGPISPCMLSSWATPIIAVPKKSGWIRICGYYSVSVNPRLQTSVCPLPKLDDLSLVRGNCFCVLDCSHAYMQLEVDENSAKILT
jgi:hypothetical protein